MTIEQLLKEITDDLVERRAVLLAMDEQLNLYETLLREAAEGTGDWYVGFPDRARKALEAMDTPRSIK